MPPGGGISVVIPLSVPQRRPVKLFYARGRDVAGEGTAEPPVELLSQEFPTAEAAAGTASILLGSLDRPDYLLPPAAAPAPPDASRMSIGSVENAGLVST